jgi:hypothetical protein
MQRIPPSAGQSRQHKQEQTVIVVEPGLPSIASQHKQLLAEQRVLGHELRTRPREVFGESGRQRRHRSGWPEQAPDEAF